MALRKKRVKRTPDATTHRMIVPANGQHLGAQPEQPCVGSDSPAPTQSPECSPFTAEYLLRLKARDPETSDHFVKFFTKRIEMMARMRGLRRHDQEDAINDTLKRALEAVDEGRVRWPEKFGAFVNGICNNVIHEIEDHEKKHSHHVSIDEVSLYEPKESAETRVLRQEMRRRVKRVLGSLRRKDRNLLRMKVFKGLSSQEMMARCGAKTPENVRVRLHRALQAFAKECEKAGLDSR